MGPSQRATHPWRSDGPSCMRGECVTPRLASAKKRILSNVIPLRPARDSPRRPCDAVPSLALGLYYGCRRGRAVDRRWNRASELGRRPNARRRSLVEGTLQSPALRLWIGQCYGDKDAGASDIPIDGPNMRLLEATIGDSAGAAELFFYAHWRRPIRMGRHTNA